MNKRVVYYTRVSTSHQSPELQEREIKDFIVKNNYELVAGFCDAGFSGSKASRPELNKLMDCARRKEFDVLIVWKLDRLARSLSHLVVLVAELKNLNIEFISLKDNIDLTTAQGKLMFGIFASLAEFEKSLICERVCSGLANAKAKGIKLGREKDSNRDDTLIRELKDKGLSIRVIAKKLEITPSKVQRSLKCSETL